MKKILALSLALLMMFAFVACGASPEDKVAKYVEDNGDELLESFEEGFAGSGMIYETEIKAEGTTIVIDVKISDFGLGIEISDEILETIKPTLQAALDSTKSELSDEFQDWKEELPELESFKMNMCTADGNVLATLEVDE